MSVSSACRWSARFEEEVYGAPDPTRSHDRLSAIEVQAEQILSNYEARSEIFPRELLDALAAHGVRASTSGLSRLLVGDGIT